MQRANFFPRFYLPLILLLCVIYAWRPLEGGYDFWAHAAVGRWIWFEKRVPYETLFLWSVEPTPWVAHSWLSQLLFYGLMEVGGRFGVHLVAVLNVVMVTLVFFLLWRLWARQGYINFLVPLLFAFAIWFSAPRFQPRQELISALFLVFLLAWLIAWSEGRLDDRRKLLHARSLSPTALSVVVLFILWINLHALVAVGLTILIATVVCDAVQDRLNARARQLIVIGVLCALATLINPYGIKYWQAANHPHANFIEEWRPMWDKPYMFSYMAVGAILIVAAILAWAANPQRRWSHLAWLIFMSAACIFSRRQFWLLAIVCLAVLAANARALDTERLWSGWRRLTRRADSEDIPTGLRLLAQSGTVLCLAAWIFAAASRHWGPDAIPWQAVVYRVPEGAVNYILKHNLQGRMFNDYEHSSYLQWRLNGPLPSGKVLRRGRYPLYIDLLNAYPVSLMKEYFEILDVTPRGRQLLKSRKINYVVLGTHHADKKIVKYLDNNQKEWKQVFKDKNSFIWLRRRQVANTKGQVTSDE